MLHEGFFPLFITTGKHQRREDDTCTCMRCHLAGQCKDIDKVGALARGLPSHNSSCQCTFFVEINAVEDLSFGLHQSTACAPTHADESVAVNQLVHPSRSSSVLLTSVLGRTTMANRRTMLHGRGGGESCEAMTPSASLELHSTMYS